MTKPKLIVTTDKPIYGNWDGGAKQRFEFAPDNRYPYQHPGAGGDIRWESWTANFWFWCKAGRTDYEALSIAERVLRRMMNAPATFERILPQMENSNDNTKTNTN